MAYSEQTRAEALLALELNNGNILQTATQLGIGEATLHRWLADAESSKTEGNEYSRSFSRKSWAHGPHPPRG